MCGESWHAMKDSLTHRPSSQGWAPGVLPFLYKCFVCLLYVLGWRDGGRRVAILTSFFSIIFILGLVCYKHTIHVYIVQRYSICNNIPLYSVLNIHELRSGMTGISLLNIIIVPSDSIRLCGSIYTV